MDSFKKKDNPKTMIINIMEILDLKLLCFNKKMITLEDKNYNGHRNKIKKEILLI